MRYSRLIQVVAVVIIVSIMLPIISLRNKLYADTSVTFTENGVSVIFEKQSSWGNSTQVSATITNGNSVDVTSWSLGLGYSAPVTVSNIWNATCDTSEGITIIPAGYNSVIEAGSSINFGYVIESSTADLLPSICEITIQINGTEITPTVTPTVTPIVTDIPTGIVTPSPDADDELSIFPYAIYTENGCSFSGWKSEIYGDVYSGTDVTYSASELDLHGTLVCDNSIVTNGWNINIDHQIPVPDSIAMPNWSQKIYSYENEMNNIPASSLSSQNSIVVNGYCYVNGDITINGAGFEGDSVIVASGNITYNVDSISESGRVYLYSENGNITINGTEITVNGVLYAPNGTVRISAYNTTVNGRIVADSFSYDGSIFNIVTRNTDIDLIYDYPQVSITASATETQVGNGIDFSVVVDDNENSEYEVLYRINSNQISLTDNNTYTLISFEIGEYVFEAYLVTSDNEEVILARKTVSVIADTPTDVPSVEPTVTPSEEPTNTPDITDAPTPEIDYDTDTDEDGLPDDIEDIIGTDKYDEDSDDDGISDYMELMIGYNPLSNDSDEDNVLDGNEDFDGDSLTNLQEIQYGTNLAMEDTDYDDLSDGDEINIYGTNPLLYDTDEDGISDGEEILIGKNPLSDADAAVKILQSTTSQINNSEDSFITAVDISMLSERYLSYVAEAEDLYNVDVYSTDVVGRLGSPIGLTSSIDFSTATVTIHYDETQLGDANENDLGVLWYDEETGFYITQTQAVVDTTANTITLELTHFSTYVVVDLNVWNNIEPIIYDGPSTEGGDVNLDIVLVIEKLSTTSDEDVRREIAVAESIIDNMREGDRITVDLVSCTDLTVHHHDYGITYVSSATDKQILKNYIERTLPTLESDDCIALTQFMYEWANYVDSNNTDVGNTRRIIDITNGQAIYFSTAWIYNVDMDDPYYAISVRDVSLSISAIWLQNHCESTGGLYLCTNSGEIDCGQLFSHLRNDMVPGDSADEDHDGLPDYWEEHGMMAINGKMYYTNPDNPDTDDDGVLDGDEMGRMITIIKENGQLVVQSDISIDIPFFVSILNIIGFEDGTYNLWIVSSNPNLKDSDGDGILDGRDYRPMIKDIRTIDLGGNEINLNEDENGYIHVERVIDQSTKSFYGGNQSWFGNEFEYDGVTYMYIEDTGCGLIASTDILQYLKKGESCIKWNKYKELVTDNYDSYLGFSVFPDGTRYSFHNSFALDIAFINVFFMGNGYFPSIYTLNQINDDKLLNYIKKSLKENKPVILLENNRVEQLPYIQEKKIALYKLQRNTDDYDGFDDINNLFSIDNSMGYHYVTITGVVNDTYNNEIYLRVQSWGEAYYIKYSEWIKFNVHNGLHEGKILVF